MRSPAKIAGNNDGGSTGGFGISVLTSDGQVGGSGGSSASGGGGSSGCRPLERASFIGRGP